MYKIGIQYMYSNQVTYYFDDEQDLNRNLYDILTDIYEVEPEQAIEICGWAELADVYEDYNTDTLTLTIL